MESSWSHQQNINTPQVWISGDDGYESLRSPMEISEMPGKSVDRKLHRLHLLSHHKYTRRYGSKWRQNGNNWRATKWTKNPTPRVQDVGYPHLLQMYFQYVQKNMEKLGCLKIGHSQIRLSMCSIGIWDVPNFQTKYHYRFQSSQDPLQVTLWPYGKWSLHVWFSIITAIHRSVFPLSKKNERLEVPSGKLLQFADLKMAIEIV